MTNETTISFAELKNALLSVKDSLSHEDAKTIINEIGEAERMADIKEERYQAVIDECQRVLAEPETDEQPEHELDRVDDEQEAPVVYACSQAMLDSAIDGLNNMSEGATVEQAINAIYNAWVHAGSVKHYD